MKTKKIILTVMYVVLATAFCLTCNVACTNFGSTNQSNNSKPEYIWIGTALREGKVTYGMTYEEIVKIVGAPDSKNKLDGVVREAHYYRPGVYGGFHLRFDSYGRFSSYSDTTSD